MHDKRHFLSYRKRRHDAQITWPYAYYVTLGSRCKMANSSSEDETDTDIAVSVWACQAGFWKSTGTSCQFRSKPHAVFHGVCEIALTEVLATQMGVMRRSKKVSSFELYKFNPLSPHCGSIARELVHCYTWGRLRIVTVRGNTVVNFFVDHTHTQFTEESKMATALTPRLTSLPGKSRDWWRTRDCSLGQPTENKID